MFKKYKIFSAIIAVIILIGLVGCAAPNETATKTDVVEEAAKAYFANLPEGNNMIKQDAFVEKVKAGEDMFILDIRQPDAYAKGHIIGAVNAPWGTAISDNLDKLPKDKTIMVYCYTAQTANQTVALLNMAGFDAKSVKFGWNLGISKVEGVEDVIETTANDFGEVEALEIEPEITTAIEEYYAGLADVKDTIYKNYKISEDNLKKLLDAKDDSIIILSIRQAKDYAEGHIPTAINIPWRKGMQEDFEVLPTDKKIVVHCYTGQTAGQTVAVLKMLGYDAVSLNGGMGTAANAPYGWSNKEYEVVQ